MDSSTAIRVRASGTERRQASPAADAGRLPDCNPRRRTLDVSERRLSLAAVLMSTLLTVAPAHADPRPFTGMAGTWGGSGTVALEDGSTERIRCRASYGVSGPRMTLVLTCASDAYKFGLQADL